MTDTEAVHHGAAERWGGWSYEGPGRGEHFRRCSYCGSVDPRDLAAEIARGLPDGVHWADMKYGWPHKFYVDIPNREPGQLFTLGSLSIPRSGPRAPGGPDYRQPEEDYVAADGLTPEQRAMVERDGMGSPDDEPDTHLRYYRFATRAVHHAKFYTTHLHDHDELTLDTKVAIERACGLTFTFEDGKVRWAPEVAPTRGHEHG